MADRIYRGSALENVLEYKADMFSGEERFYYDFKSIRAEWVTEAITPAGTLTFTVDGDNFGGNNIIDLGAGARGLECSSTNAYVDITPAGLPAGAIIRLYFRV